MQYHWLTLVSVPFRKQVNKVVKIWSSDLQTIMFWSHLKWDTMVNLKAHCQYYCPVFKTSTWNLPLQYIWAFIQKVKMSFAFKVALMYLTRPGLKQWRNKMRLLARLKDSVLIASVASHRKTRFEKSFIRSQCYHHHHHCLYPHHHHHHLCQTWF